MGKFIDELASGLEGLEGYNWVSHQSDRVTYLIHQGNKRTYHSIIRLVPAGDEKYNVVGTVFRGCFTEPESRVYGYISNGPVSRLEIKKKVCGVFSDRIRRNRNVVKTA